MPDMSQDGKTRRIGRERAIVLDVVRLARRVPSFPVERWFELSDVACARQFAKPRISWVSLFARAYGIAGLAVPELRQAYVGGLIPRVYQSPYSVISVAVNRQTDLGDQLFFGRLRFPEQLSLVEIQQELEHYVNGDIKQAFRQQLQSSMLPSLLRRLAWWWRLQIAVKKRARRVGTGSISVLASQGVYNALHPSILTSSLSYGPQQADGRMWVTLQCDHRVMDGAAAARAINAIHDALRGQLLDELKQLHDT
ncbi:MAG: hypothetical protein R3C53_22755 [Pirellulaceae bacterium]